MNAFGEFEPDNCNLSLSFSGKIANHPTFQKAEPILREMAKAMDGTFRAFPLWEGLEPFVTRKSTIS